MMQIVENDFTATDMVNTIETDKYDIESLASSMSSRAMNEIDDLPIPLDQQRIIYKIESAMSVL